MKLSLSLRLVLLHWLPAAFSQISFNQRSPQSLPQQQRFDIVFDDTPPATSPTCLTPEQRAGSCKSLAECAIFFAEIPSLLENPCETGNGQRGVCCPVSSNQAQKPPKPGVGLNGVLAPPPPPPVDVPKISQQQLQESVDISIRSFNAREKNANRILFDDKITVPKGSPAASHQNFFTTTNAILDEGNKAQLNIETSMTLVNNFQLSKLQGTFALPHISARNTPIANTCPAQSVCRPNFPYRTMDGSCNNVKNPDWGKAGMAFQRILPPKYQDGVNSPRTQGVSGQLLPSPRLVSSSFIPDEDRPYSNFTLMIMQWGQFLDHDFTHTPIVKGTNQTSISCCQRGQFLQPNQRHPDCFPIDIPANDPFFGPFNQRCMDFVRSLPAPRRECNFGPREQMSQITAYIDASNVYGSGDSKAASLREGRGGRLLVQKNGGKDLLPANPGECSDREKRRFCFKAGDVRVNEQIELAVMHTIWMREHNRVAGELLKLNPNWSDEIVYQEARRIVIAQIQHITYNEFLPLILGPEFMRTFSLHPVQKGYTGLYNPEVDPTITNAFATAAYRFGHSLVQGMIKGFNQFGAVSEAMSLEKSQFSPFSLYDSFDSFVRGLTTQECQRFDNFVSDSLTKHLFQGGSSFGLDLMSLNIQRGRDHALPPYNDWREVCGLPKVSSWEELGAVMSPQAVSTLRRVYESVDDIDLFAGALGETNLPDAILGPVFVCLVGDQFARLRRGDRFFYEERTARFTEAQLNQIRKVSLARVLCDNSDDITVIQPLVMQQASFLNRRLPCNTDVIPGIDFNFWKEARRGGQNQQQQRQPPQNQSGNQAAQNPNNNFGRPNQGTQGQNSNFGRPNQGSQNFGQSNQFQNQASPNQDFGQSGQFPNQGGQTQNFGQSNQFQNPGRPNQNSGQSGQFQNQGGQGQNFRQPGQFQNQGSQNQNFRQPGQFQNQGSQGQNFRQPGQFQGQRDQRQNFQRPNQGQSFSSPNQFFTQGGQSQSFGQFNQFGSQQGPNRQTFG